MHADPRHPLWWRIPYGVAALMALATGAAVWDLNVNENQSAWVGIALAPLGGALWVWAGWLMRKEYR